MTSTKIITVFGATGLQGGSVVASLLQDKSGSFSVRGISRNIASEKSKALIDRGVEMVQADGLVKEQIAAAVKGSWGLYVNTNTEDKAIGNPGGPTETDIGKIIVDAAAEAGVQHFVYSGMASAAEITNGAVPNPAFDEKHAIGEYAKTKNFKTVNLVSPGWYLENHLVEELAPLFGGFPFTADEEGYLTLHVPRWGGNEEIGFIGIGDDYGDLVHGAFLDPERYNGQLVQGISVSATAGQLMEAFQKGKKARYVARDDWKTFETYGDKGLETVKYMFGFCQHSGGLYWGVPNDTFPASSLKNAAAKAQGKLGNERGLISLEDFFRKHFK